MKFHSGLIFKILILLFIGLAATAGDCFANDLNDGITIDDGIPGAGSIDKVDQNISYIITKALSKSGKADTTVINVNKQGDINQGSIILEPGAEADEIILIYEGDNNTLINK